MNTISPADVRKYVQQHSDQVVALCQKLVSIPSENPPGDTTELVKFLHHYLKETLNNNNCAARVNIISPKPKIKNIVCTIEGYQEGNKHLIFNGHLDTFPAGDLSKWSIAPFAGKISDEKLYGRGAADMKGGITSSIFAFAALAKYRKHWAGKASLTLVSDEETGGKWGTQYLLKKFPELKGTAVINGEPSGIHMISLGEKGRMRLEFKINTLGGHGAYSFSEKNAIFFTMDFLNDLLSLNELNAVDIQIDKWLNNAKEYYEKIRGQNSVKATKQVTVNCGYIKGGTLVNMVPEECSIEVDVRIPPGMLCDDVISNINTIINKYREVDISFKVLQQKNPTITYPDASDGLFNILNSNARAVVGADVYPIITIGGTDLRFWRTLGIPAIAYGPEHFNMGKPDEYIFIDSLCKTAEVQAGTAFQYLINN